MESENRIPAVLYDSSIIFYCAGQIGYRWAVKVAYMAAANLVYGVMDTLGIQEVLDYFHRRKDPDRGRVLSHNAREIMHELIAVTEDDFLLSRELFEKHPETSPRVLLRSAIMINNGISRVCATYAAGFESIASIRRVNLMEKVDHFERICHRL